jgi:hypothetical protein
VWVKVIGATKKNSFRTVKEWRGKTINEKAYNIDLISSNYNFSLGIWEQESRRGVGKVFKITLFK